MNCFAQLIFRLRKLDHTSKTSNPSNAAEPHSSQVTLFLIQMKYFILIIVKRKDFIPKWNGCYYKIQTKTLKVGACKLKTNIKKEANSDI